ncbi:hypothetical protein AJ79_09225 [Helicocarpus griseus UAMH5409]|uniref:Uncharacterized protein n=1 Tax=Helicocarpus griseus UAMH5409 TaxID=1447875 RepID=A0A2B7WL41_9EURO|nr:hypothetical protein AJ79_09225 [Helicocarpus griseus UAMH5409]
MASMEDDKDRDELRTMWPFDQCQVPNETDSSGRPPERSENIQLKWIREVLKGKRSVDNRRPLRASRSRSDLQESLSL